MSLGTKFSALAVRMITDADKWTHEATFTYGPRREKANKWDEASDADPIDPETLKVAAFQVEKALEEGGRKVAMWEIYVPAASITVRPTEEDRVTLDSVAYEIHACIELGANAVDAVYQVMAVR